MRNDFGTFFGSGNIFDLCKLRSEFPDFAAELMTCWTTQLEHDRKVEIDQFEQKVKLIETQYSRNYRLRVATIIASCSMAAVLLTSMVVFTALRRDWTSLGVFGLSLLGGGLFQVVSLQLAARIQAKYMEQTSLNIERALQRVAISDLEFENEKPAASKNKDESKPDARQNKNKSPR